MSRSDLDLLGRADDWRGVHVVVDGFGAAGYAAADNLTFLGASVVAHDAAGDDYAREQAQLLESLGATIRLGAKRPPELPDDAALVVATRETDEPSPLVDQARRRGLPVWSEVELAWRLRDPDRAAEWILLAGVPAEDRVVQMLSHVLHAGGVRARVVGEGGVPIVEAVMDPQPSDLLVVPVTVRQLRDTRSVSPQSAVVLSGREPEAAHAYRHVRQTCVYPVEDPGVIRMVEEADVVEGARAIGITLGTPSVGMLGLVEDLLVDRAFIAERATSAAELCALRDLVTEPAAGIPEGSPGEADPAVVRDALVACALARGHGVPRVAVREGLRAHAAR